jgi:hypothetical protein
VKIVRPIRMMRVTADVGPKYWLVKVAPPGRTNWMHGLYYFIMRDGGSKLDTISERALIEFGYRPVCELQALFAIEETP